MLWQKGVLKRKTFPQILLLCLLWAQGCGSAPDLISHLEEVLQASWRSYRQHFMTPEGRVVIPERDGGTISEAQAYALLRAVWAGDEATFGRVYAWTHKHLSRRETHQDSLLAWHWGRLPGGSSGVLDWNTATDADLDYALALMLAARRGWPPPSGLPHYATEAQQVLAGILSLEVVELPGGELLLTPGNWHEERPPYLVNPSYFSPAAYRLFGKSVGQGKDMAPQPKEVAAGPVWEGLHRSTYQLLGRINRMADGNPGPGLFPDWCRVDAQGRITPAPDRGSQFGWEAVRLPWRLALDQLWFGESRAVQIIGRNFLSFFKKEWQDKGRLAAVYNLDGTPAVDYESPVLYAGVLAAALSAGDRDFAGHLARKILSFYHVQGDRTFFVDPDNYYADNWAWLGLALYAGWVRLD